MNPTSEHRLMLIAAVFIACATDAAQAADLRVEIEGVSSKEGTVEVGLFDQEQGFPDRYTRGISVPAAGSAVTVVFTDLPPGRYAVSAYQDRNSNGRLDRGFTGFPSEPYGFSRDARGVFGPPEFGDAAFELATQNTTIRFTLK